MKCKIVSLLAIALAVVVGSTAAANDELIAQQIIQRLQQQKTQAQLQDFNIGIQVDKGTVTVMGTVTEADHALIALDVARRVPGVKLVVNDLFVQGQQQAANPVQQATAITPADPAKSQAISVQAVTLPTQTVAVPPQAQAVPPMAAAPAQLAPQTVPATPIGSGANPAQNQPLAFAQARSIPQAQGSAPINYRATPAQYGAVSGAPVPMNQGMMSQASYDNPQVPGYAWPSYASYPNYSAVTYPQQYSPTAWPYIGPFYPYPQVPLGWRKVTLEWDDGWWFLDFKAK